MATASTYQTLFLLFIIFFQAARSSNYPAIFNFGDSNSDTGNLVAGVGQILDPPYGQTYFGEPSGRASDGRLIIDFLMEAMELPFVSPYLDAIGAPTFRRGCNFAASGATIVQPDGPTLCPFSLGIQVAQFVRFKNRVENILAKTRELNEYIPEGDYFENGLYMFDTGQNDLTHACGVKTVDQVIALIPAILLQFERGIKVLYGEGARRFRIHNTGPLGCLPMEIVQFRGDPSKLDELGCVASRNLASRVFNLQLHALYKKLQAKYLDAKFTYVDIFSIKLDLIANYSTYGFEKPLMACCGYGGPPTNYDSRINCGETKVVNGNRVTTNVCNDSTKYVNWDGIHYTEAANRHVAMQILTGKYSDPPPADDEVPSFLKLSSFL